MTTKTTFAVPSFAALALLVSLGGAIAQSPDGPNGGLGAGDGNTGGPAGGTAGVGTGSESGAPGTGALGAPSQNNAETAKDKHKNPVKSGICPGGAPRTADHDC